MRPFTPEEREQFKARGATDAEIDELPLLDQRFSELLDSYGSDENPGDVDSVEKELLGLQSRIRHLLQKFGLYRGTDLW